MDRVLSLTFEDAGLAPIESVAIPQIVSGSLSFITSSVMAIMIVRAEKGLSTPYRRILFALSVCDIIQSLAIVGGPFAVPHDTAESWGVGNKNTCTVAGFLLTFGMSTVPKYTCLLTFYYLCRVKYRMTDEEFGAKFERVGHFLIIFYGLVFTMTVFGFDLYNPGLNRSYCKIASSPTGCRWFPEVVGECELNIKELSSLLAGLDGIISYFLTLVAIIIIMGLLYWHAFMFNRRFRPSSSQRAPAAASSPASSEGEQSEGENNDDQPESARDSEEHREVLSLHHRERISQLSKLYMREAILQVSCYVGAYCVVYVPILIFLFSYARSIPSETVQILTTALYPIGGVLNMLAYTRPEIASLRREHPEFSWFRSFWVVIKTGGEKPQQVPRRNQAMSISQQIEAFQAHLYVQDCPQFDSALAFSQRSSIQTFSYGITNFNSDEGWSCGESQFTRSRGGGGEGEEFDEDLSISQFQVVDL